MNHDFSLKHSATISLFPMVSGPGLSFCGKTAPKDRIAAHFFFFPPLRQHMVMHANAQKRTQTVRIVKPKTIQ